MLTWAKEKHPHKYIPELRPRDGRNFIPTLIPGEAEVRRDDHHIDSAVLRRHHIEVSEHEVLLSPHGFEFRGGHHDGMWRNEDEKTDRHDEQQIFDVPQMVFGVSHPAHAMPQIITGGEKQRVDHSRLNDAESGQRSSHPRNAHLLSIGIHLLH